MRQLFRTLLVAINSSEASMDAFKYALAMKKQHGSRIVACYIIDTATIRQLTLSRIFVPDESEEYEASLAMTGKRYLGFCNELAQAKRMEIETVLEKGSVSGEIIKLAEDLKADCIVIGCQPADSLYRDAICDANIEILKHSRCPVLFIKPGEGKEQYQAI